jgi:hypothetical protein
MLFIHLLVNEKLLAAEAALSRVDNPEMVIVLCREYLGLLHEYRDELGKIGCEGILSKRHTSSLARELTEQVRRAIRTAIEVTTRERNYAERLLESLTAISGYAAMETFNTLSYKGLTNWEVRSGGVRADDQFMTIDESVTAARGLRCAAFASSKRVFFSETALAA